MKHICIILALAFVFLLESNSVEAKCSAKNEKDTPVCADKNETQCKGESVCSWVQSTATIGTSKSCKAKPGSETHSDFCKSQNEQACSVHTKLCSWK